LETEGSAEYMKIDAENGWFKGLGDIVCYAWIGQGIREAGGDVAFYCNGWRAELFELFGMPTTNDPEGAVVTHDGYEQAIEHGSRLNYLEWIADRLGVTAKPQRPKLNMTPMDRELGRMASAQILIFPHGVWPTRVWPKAYYLELALMLAAQGYTIKIVCEERDYDFLSYHQIFKKPWGYIAGAIQWANLVIGNDSGPAHLAGTIGTRALAIHGPTQERIYAYLPEVTSYRKKALPCAGCHCLPPFPKGGACSSGCGELYRTFPEDVFAAAVAILEQQTSKAA
jgi:hypothetical protein